MDTITIIDAERAGERGEIDAAVADQRAFIGEGDAHRVVAQEPVVNLPAQPVLQRGRIQEHALARALDRPLALDTEEGAAFLGTSARERSQALAAQQAPDFSLPDLDGRLHTLREHRGKKILLVAWASW